MGNHRQSVSKSSYIKSGCMQSHLSAVDKRCRRLLSPYTSENGNM